MEEAFLVALFNIIILDLVLSGDNAVVIGMAVQRLPPRQKRIAILTGGGLALVLRVALTAVATYLLQIPLLQVLGAVVLVWITYRLLTEGGEEESLHGQREDAGFVKAMQTIIIADVTMSLDNVLAVGAAAHGDLTLLIIGLGLSMAILVAGGTIVSVLLTRMAWLNYVGAAVLVVLAGEMIAKDHYLTESHIIAEDPILPWIFSAIIAVVLVALMLIRRSRRNNATAQAQHHTDSAAHGEETIAPAQAVQDQVALGEPKK